MGVKTTNKERSQKSSLIFFLKKIFKFSSQCHLLTTDGFGFKMTFLTNWEDFEKAAERLYLQDPMKARFVTQYDHSKGSLGMKMTDDVVCIQFKTDAAQDVRRMEKFVNNLMRHMASKEHN